MAEISERGGLHEHTWVARVRPAEFIPHAFELDPRYTMRVRIGLHDYIGNGCVFCSICGLYASNSYL